MSLSSAKAKLDAQGGDPVTGYISKTDHKESYDELLDDTALTGATTAEAITVSGAAVAGTLNGRDPDDLAKGPASATDNALVRFDGTDGKTVQNSGITVDDSNNVSGVGTFASGAITSSAAVQAAAASGFVSGASGPKVGLSGTGSPEGVVTAPVGSDYRDTNATTGAIKWIKASGTGNTGWVVEYGDTGWRNLAAESMSNSWTVVSSTFGLRRVGRSVFIRAAFSAASASASTVYTLPSGFRAFGNEQWFVPDSASSGRRCYVGSDGTINILSYAATSYFVSVTYTTNDTWPSSLPGSAA